MEGCEAKKIILKAENSIKMKWKNLKKIERGLFIYENVKLFMMNNIKILLVQVLLL